MRNKNRVFYMAVLLLVFYVYPAAQETFVFCVNMNEARKLAIKDAEILSTGKASVTDTNYNYQITEILSYNNTGYAQVKITPVKAGDFTVIDSMRAQPQIYKLLYTMEYVNESDPRTGGSVRRFKYKTYDNAPQEVNISSGAAK